MDVSYGVKKQQPEGDVRYNATCVYYDSEQNLVSDGREPPLLAEEAMDNRDRVKKEIEERKKGVC